MWTGLRIAWTVCAAVLLAIWLTAGAHAQAPIPVVAGKQTTVATAPTEITIKVKPSGGSASVNPPSAGDSNFKLVYQAGETSAAATDTLTYSAGGQDVTLQIQITPAGPAGPNLDINAYPKAFSALVLLFFLAVVLESALAVIFNWRPFVETFNPRAVRPLVAVIVAYFLVHGFKLDLIASLVDAIRPGVAQASDSFFTFSQTLTALVIAGGSAGVNSLLIALGYRQIKTPETVAPKPPPDKAWIAVKARRVEAVGPIEVLIGPAPAVETNDPPIVGVIPGDSGGGPFSYFLANKGRFPAYGGHTLQPDATEYVVVLSARSKDPSKTEPVKVRWGPRAFAKGAIVDIEISI